MSDETVRPDGWSAEPGAGGAYEPVAGGQETAEKRVGFCQDCGKPLTRETVRTVGSGVFCEPCLEARVVAAAGQTAAAGYGSSAGYGSVAGAPPAAGYPPAAGAPPAPGAVPNAGYAGAGPSSYGAAPATSDEPSPALAFVLGLIPGVGAMYNGQFAKAVVHFVIFAVLVSLSKDVNGVFGLFVTGWIFYMAFEAHHTARARLLGLPLPNTFGFNDIGERMGFGKTWGAVGTVRTGAGEPIVVGGPMPATGPGSPPVAGPGSTYVPAGTVPVGTGPDWVGYVPPTVFASAPPVAAGYPAAGYATTSYASASYANPAAQAVQAQAMRDAGFAAAPPYAAPHSVPYVETHTGIPGAPVVVPPVRRFPVGALWLIGLGVLILAANLFPEWRLSERWLLPLLFAGLSLWTLTRRLRSGVSIACMLRWPLILMVLAVLFALQAAYVATLGQTWPVLFIALGALLLLERMAGSGAVYVAPVAATTGFGGSGYTSVVPEAEPVTSSDEARTRAGWTANEGDPTKGGQ